MRQVRFIAPESLSAVSAPVLVQIII